MRPLAQLRKHPAYVDLKFSVSAAQLAEIQRLGNLPFKDPILITAEGIIIDGYARRELAEKQGIPALCCVEFNIDEEEALHRILSNHRRSSGWNDFNRIRMASKLRAEGRNRAFANQQAGGKLKGSSKLTEASRVDLRKEIAKAAGVSEGSVTKVDQLGDVQPEILQALHSGEIRIHRAWKWRTLGPDEQAEQLRLYRLERGLKTKVRTLISKHRAETPETGKRSSITIADLNELAERLFAVPSCAPGESESIVIGLIDAPGKVIFMTTELFQAVSAEKRQNATYLESTSVQADIERYDSRLGS